MQDKLENNYSVYQHVTPDNMYYFGATSNIKRRWSNNGAKYKKTSLQPYIEKFGWDNIQHIVLFENQTRENALWIEDFLITTAREDGVCINKHRSGLVSKEEGYDQQYYEQNKDKKSDYNREYYQQNKEQILEQTKQYYEQNKDKKSDYNREYYQQNKDKIKETSKQYYETNKDKIKQYYEENKEKIKQKYQKRKLQKQLQPDGCLSLW